MPWFRVDDQLATHPKWLALPKGARALWVTAGAWASSQLTDGFVPTFALRALDGNPTEARQLVDAGLWRQAEGGWQFHDWSQYQPSRESVLADREAAKERMRRAREARRAEREQVKAP